MSLMYLQYIRSLSSFLICQADYYYISHYGDKAKYHKVKDHAQETTDVGPAHRFNIIV